MKSSCSVMSDSLRPQGLYIAHQAPPCMGFSRQEYWNGLPCPSAGDLPDLGIEPGSPALQADALPSEPPGKPQKNLGRKIKVVGAGNSFTFKNPGLNECRDFLRKALYECQLTLIKDTFYYLMIPAQENI